jgi:hypothetical protein
VPSWTCWSSFRVGGWLSLVPGVASVAQLPKRLPHAKHDPCRQPLTARQKGREK